MHHVFLYISQPSLRDCNFTRPLYGVDEHNTKLSFSLVLNLDMILSDSTPENFANIRQIK